MTLEQLILQMQHARSQLASYEHHALEKIGKKVAKDAASYLGEYQSSVGPFAAWSQLSDSTLASKEKAGAPTPSPLLRTGEMKKSIQTKVEAHKVVVGSPMDIAKYQELGTSNARHPIPPRSFLGRAMYTNEKWAAHEIGKAAFNCITGKPKA